MTKDVKTLDMEKLEKVNGGFVVGDQKQNKYCVVRQDGTVLVPAPTKEKAIEFAKAYNVSQTVMTSEEYQKHFGRPIEW